MRYAVQIISPPRPTPCNPLYDADANKRQIETR